MASLVFALVSGTVPAQAQSARETARLTVALRQNGCLADEADMNRSLPDLKMPRDKV